MNRREFLIAVGAVSVVSILPSYAAATSRWTGLSATTFQHAWQQRIWDLLESGKEVMYVTGTQKSAWKAFNLFERHKLLHCTCTGGALAGRGADLIIMDDYIPTNPGLAQTKRYQEWYNTAIKTRVNPKGKIIRYKYTGGVVQR